MADTCPGCSIEGVTFAVWAVGNGGLTLREDPAGKFGVREGIVREWRQGDGKRYAAHFCQRRKAAAK